MDKNNLNVEFSMNYKILEKDYISLCRAYNIFSIANKELYTFLCEIEDSHEIKGLQDTSKNTVMNSIFYELDNKLFNSSSSITLLIHLSRNLYKENKEIAEFKKFMTKNKLISEDASGNFIWALRNHLTHGNTAPLSMMYHFTQNGSSTFFNISLADLRNIATTEEITNLIYDENKESIPLRNIIESYNNLMSSMWEDFLEGLKS